MRKVALGIATATAVLASPALARDGSMYAGIEAGVDIPEDIDFDVTSRVPTLRPDPGNIW